MDEVEEEMLKSIARAAGLLAYLLITFEMLFMITPFALYYYSIYSPLLSWPSRFPATAWLPAFFLPHLSSEVFPSVGTLIFLLGLAGFILCALQLYYMKFRRRGVVQGGFYKRIRHPQYLLLAISGLGLLILWPRFILVLAYVNMLWLYYFLARNEEWRMETRYGETYHEHKTRTWMFLPGEPGARLSRQLFGWIRHRRVRLLVIYGLTVAGSVGAGFALRLLSLIVTPHLSLPDQKIAAVSFLSENGGELRNLVESVSASSEIQNYFRERNSWVLLQAMEGNRPVVHLVIDAGMTRPNADHLPLAKEGIKLVFSRRKDRPPHADPFSAWARWQPVLVAEMEGQKISRVIELEQGMLAGNPVMPIF